MLVRDMAITRTRSSLLDSAIVLFVPIFNVDGHERFGPFNRINQNGPEEMGWRVTARNLNLNRDYLKADAPEMRALLRLFAAWEPDLYIDCHVTDGIDFQYDVTYTTEMGPQIDAGVGCLDLTRPPPRHALRRGAGRAQDLLVRLSARREGPDPGHGRGRRASAVLDGVCRAPEPRGAAHRDARLQAVPDKGRGHVRSACLISGAREPHRVRAAVRRPSRGRNPDRAGPEGRDGSP